MINKKSGLTSLYLIMMYTCLSAGKFLFSQQIAPFNICLHHLTEKSMFKHTSQSASNCSVTQIVTYSL